MPYIIQILCKEDDEDNYKAVESVANRLIAAQCAPKQRLGKRVNVLKMYIASPKTRAQCERNGIESCWLDIFFKNINIIVANELFKPIRLWNVD